MPTVDEIPQAAQIQTQLAQIEAAIAALEKNAKVSAVMVTAPLPEDTSPLTASAPTMVTLQPPIAIDNLIAALRGQQELLIDKLDGMGFEYTGSASPSQSPLPAPPEAPKFPLVPPLPERAEPPTSIEDA